jgi:hypothetical protein
MVNRYAPVPVQNWELVTSRTSPQSDWVTSPTGIQLTGTGAYLMVNDKIVYRLFYNFHRL